MINILSSTVDARCLLAIFMNVRVNVTTTRKSGFVLKLRSLYLLFYLKTG